jgi:hypothetical protein
MNCPSSLKDRALAAAAIAKSTISALCDNVSGLNCWREDKVVINKFCGQDIQQEGKFDPRSRLLASSADSVVEFTIILKNIAESDVRQKDALLSKYLQGSSLDTILADILDLIDSTSTSQSLQSISAIYYEFINSFVGSLGLFYPSWGTEEQTCLNDAKQPGMSFQCPNSNILNYNPFEISCFFLYF